jgi:hypothetical protein
MEFGGDKLVRLFKQFVYAPNLRVVKIDMDKANPKPILEPFLAANTPLEKLTLHNVTFDFGLGFLRDLETNKSLKKLVIQFLRFANTDKKQHVFIYEGENTSLESLKLCFSTLNAVDAKKAP